ncbi:hypothetical protein DCO46_08950 [Flavobacterium sp. HTF]|nr:hypothetical protein DCO46_08950 [Flavobacterium sp. HTF]
MIKKIFTPALVVVLIWGIGHLLINQYYYEYLRPYQYLSIILAIPFAIYNLNKQRKEDKINNTENFKSSIYSMLFMAVIMIAFFFITKQDHI